MAPPCTSRFSPNRNLRFMSPNSPRFAQQPAMPDKSYAGGPRRGDLWCVSHTIPTLQFWDKLNSHPLGQGDMLNSEIA